MVGLAVRIDTAADTERVSRLSAKCAIATLLDIHISVHKSDILL